MKKITTSAAIIAVAITFAAVLATNTLNADKTLPPVQDTTKARVARGEYLVTIGGCNDCHTPFKMGPNGPEPDMSRALSGHPQDFPMPEPPPSVGKSPWMWSGAATNTAFAGPWGISFARNLTPDPVSGIGIWDEALFMKTIRTGRHWGTGRPILPPMPWFNYAKATDEDLKSIYAYLRTIKPIRNEVPDAVIAPPPPQG